MAAYNYKRRYGLTLEDLARMFERQGGCCAICEKELKEGRSGMCVDHDHTTRAVRGLLCHACNTGIGKLEDDADLLRKAARYVSRSRIGF